MITVYIYYQTMRNTARRTVLVFFILAMNLALLDAQEAEDPTIAVLVIPGDGVSDTLELIIRESVALQLERYAFRVEQFPFSDLPDGDNARFRLANRRGFDYAIVVTASVDDEEISYQFTFVEIAGRQEIAAATGRTTVDFTLDRVLQAVAYDTFERGIATLVQPIDFTGSNEAVAELETMTSVVAAEPGGIRAVISTTVFIAVADTSDYIDALAGSDLFFGWAVPATGFSLGVGTGLYRGTAEGDAVDARATFVPLGLEFRNAIGSGRLGAVVHARFGGLLVGLNTQTRGTEWEIVPAVEGGVAARLRMRRGSAIIFGAAYTVGLEDTLLLTGVRPMLSVEIGL